MKQLSLISFVLTSLLGTLTASPTEQGGFQLLPSNGNNPNPTRCETNKMCTDYCKTINPGVNVVGTCGNDKSCTCANEGNRVRVRLVEEKPPADTQWVPQVLNCNGSEYTLVICRAFCKSLSYGGGYCNTRQLTCVCSGVHPAVVQEAPIPAIFNFYLDKIPTPEKSSPKPSMLQEWTPITTSANTGNQFTNQYQHPGNPYNNQPFHYSNSQPQYSASNTNNAVQQSSSPSGLNQNPPQQGLYDLPSNYWQWQHQYPQEYFQQHFANSAQTVSTSVSAESASSSSGNSSTNANVTVVNSEPDPSSRVPVSSTDAAVASSKNPSSPRRKRSAGSSYSNAFSTKQA